MVTSFGLSKNKDEEIARRFAVMNVRSEDIQESFVRASGPGGQNVNKVASCVWLKHVPTGIEVKCQKERLQALNRYWAYRLLLDKIDEKQSKERAKLVSQKEKLKRQNRKRPRALKEKILEKKKNLSEKKSFRKKIRVHHAHDF